MGLVLGLASLIAMAGCADGIPEDTVTLDRGSIVATIDGHRRDAAEISLPLNWDTLYPRTNGRAAVTFDFPRPPGSTDAVEPYAILAFRLGNAYAIELNGIRLASFGDLDAHYEPRASKQPVRVTFPANVLAEQNRLVVELRGDNLRHAGLSPVTLGPASLVEPLYGRAYAYRVMVPIGCSILSVLVSAFCLLLWLQQREPLYAWAAIGEAIWAVVVLDVVWSPLPVPWREWVVILLIFRVIWVWSLYVVLEQLCGPHPRLERRAMKIVNFSGPVMLVLGAVIASSSAPYQLWRALLTILLIAALVRMLLSRAQTGALERFPIPIAVVVLLAAGVHDALAERRISTFYGDPDWAKYAGSLLAITIMWIVSMRFKAARREATELQATLAARVEARERDLRETYARVSELERSRAVTAERERILRDMHDGVGANLATAMRQLESGGAPAAEVATTLRESLDHLKLSIDAMSLPAGDVNALLASLRYRLQRRIESAGLTLEWHVDPLPSWSAGTNQSMRHLQFLLLEAISNALQHSRARTLTLSAHGNDDSIAIALRDDGDGIGNQSEPVLQSARSRANAIGAELIIEPAMPGTKVIVTLPNAAVES